MALIPITRPSRRSHELPRAILEPRVRGTNAFLRTKHGPHGLSQPVLRIAHHTKPFRGSAIVPTILFFLSRALKWCLYPQSADTEAAIFTAVSGKRFILRSPVAGSCICTPPVQYQTLQVDFPEGCISPARYLWTCWTRVPACDVILTPAVI
jgi:hypothetical protein